MVIGFVVLAVVLVIAFRVYTISNDIRYPRNGYPKKQDQEEKVLETDKTEKEAKQFTSRLEELFPFRY